jgi:mono/diheme cytochrome c family protein
LVSTASLSVSEPHASSRGPFDSVVRPFLAQHCFYCHGEARQKGGIAFTEYPDEARALSDRELFEDVREELSKGEMPPEGRPRPPKKDIDAVIAWIDSSLGTVGGESRSKASDLATTNIGNLGNRGNRGATAAKREIDPGRVTLRRLNRTQYENTIRDLAGVDYDAACEFPSDDVGYGFDDIGDVLSMPDILMEKYLAAAERIADAAVISEDPAHPPVARFGADKLEGMNGNSPRNHEIVLYSVSEVAATHGFPRDGEYVLRVKAYGEQAGPDPARMALRVDGKEVAHMDVKAVAAAPETYEARVRLSGGKRRVTAAFVNDYYKPDDPDPKNRDRNLVVESLAIIGPVDSPALSAFQRRYLSGAERADSAAREREVLEEVALHAYRRPATRAEIDRLIALSPPEASLASCVHTALEAMLVSPNFLFLVELDPEPPDRGARHTAAESRGGGSAGHRDESVSARDADRDRIHAIDDWELASRLSYFLWSSMPDDELFTRAEDGTLHEPDVLAAETLRMLRDARSTALTRDFASQWLQVRNLDHAAPDPTRFPEFDEELRAAMKAETAMFFDAVLRENRSVWTLIDSDFTFVNERLAKHYGIPGVHGSEMRRVRLQGGPRGGVLTQASVLTVTSNPTRTSPVKRGKWILETLIGKPTPPPPPGVGMLDESKAATDAASLRDRLAQHRSNPECSACHARLDPLGLALENFDAVGAWRDHDGAFAIDSTSALADGRTFHGPGELKQILTSDESFVRCLTKSLATFALGRGVTAADEPAIDELVRSLADKPPTLTDVILGIVHLDAFRSRRAEKERS